MIEVKYTRWKVLLQVTLGLLLALGGGILLVKAKGSTLAGAVALFVGLIFIQRARIRLKERNVILRLTPNLVWTKELGWQPWGNLLFTLARGKNNTIEIRRLTGLTPRFFEWVGTLTIKEDELATWIRRFATNYQIDN